jgi:cytidine deaminase
MDILIPTEPVDETDVALVDAATAALRRGFIAGRHHVAAALRLADGSVVTGLHLGSRRVNICAEQIALGIVVSQALADPVACASVIQMTADAEPEPTSPCGVCREVLGFFAPTMTVVLPHRDQLVRARFGDLLPAPWLLPGENLSDPDPSRRSDEG